MSDTRIRNMSDFATASGLSRPTVSKFFHDPSSVRKSTRERIERALEKFDYRPNIFAINQNRKFTKNVGILVPYLSDPFFAEIARNIERRCIEAGYWPVLFSSHGEPEYESHALETMLSLKPAGALIAPLGRASDLKSVQEFTEEVPTVVFDSPLEEIGEAFVGSNNFQSVGLIVDYLSRTGEPPCFLEMPPVNPNADTRRLAYFQAMERLGHVPHVVHVGARGWEFEQMGLIEGKRLIAEGGLPTNTILCSNDRIAIGLLAAAYEKGLRVGRGSGCALRVAGHDDHPWSRFTCPGLTTVSQDYASIAAHSVETLFRVIERDQPPEPRKTTLFEGKLVLRESA